MTYRPPASSSFGSGPGSFLERTGFSLTPWVKRLLVANVAVWAVGLVVPSAFIIQWFGFVPAETLFRPWAILTYMFVHGGFFHLLFNMLVVFFFGPPLESRLGGTEFLKLYLLAGLGGALLGFVFAFDTAVIGASGAAFGLMVAFAWLWPNAPIYIWGIFPIKAKFLVGAMVIFTFLATMGDSQSTTAHFAHLGGIVAAVFYLRWGMGGSGTPSFLARMGRTPRVAIVQRAREAAADGRRRQAEASASPGSGNGGKSRGPDVDGELLDEVDRILDKISASGISSLTDEERRVLDEVSRRRRSN
jgi:membrane associated rhomboid family serine protease